MIVVVLRSKHSITCNSVPLSIILCESRLCGIRRYLGDVIEASEAVELFGLQFGLEMGSDDGNVENDQLQAAGS